MGFVIVVIIALAILLAGAINLILAIWFSRESYTSSAESKYEALNKATTDSLILLIIGLLLMILSFFI